MPRYARAPRWLIFKYFFFFKHRDDLFSYFYIDDVITAMTYFLILNITAIKYFLILNINAITTMTYFWFQTLP